MATKTPPPQYRLTTTTSQSAFKTPQKPTPSQLAISDMETLHEDDTRQYLKWVELFINNQRWTIKVGDLTMCNNKHKNDDTPFTITAAAAYQPVQILSIYRKRQKNKLSSSGKKRKKRYETDVNVEVRYFYRGRDLDGWSQRCYCGGHYDGDSVGNNEEEVLESDRVEVVNASSLLGCLVLNATHFNSSTASGVKANDDKKSASTESAVPTVTMNYNHRLYLHQEQDVLQFNPLKDTTDALLLRGIKSSRIMTENDEVKLATCDCLNLTVPNNDGGKDVDQVVILPPPTLSMQQQQKEDGTSISSNRTTHYYPACQLQFTTSPTVHPYESLPISHWNVCVGDVVAVKCQDGIISPIAAKKRDGQKRSNNEWYPYRVPWVHAQITSIYRHVDTATAIKSDDSNGTSTTMTVSACDVQYDLRLFPRISESLNGCQDDPVLSKSSSEVASDENRACKEILEGNYEMVGFDFTTLLGPILIVNNDDGKSDDTASLSTASAPFATRNRRTINSTMHCDEYNQPKQLSSQKQAGNDSDGIADRGIEASQLWMSRNSQRNVYREAVLQSRRDRDDGVPITMDDDHESVSAASIHFDDNQEDSLSQEEALPDSISAPATAARTVSDAPVPTTTPLPASSPVAAPTVSDAPVPNTTPKARRSKRAKTPVAKAETEYQPKKRKETKHDEVTVDENHVSISASIHSLLNESAAADAPKTRRSKRGKSPVVPRAEPEPKPKKRKQLNYPQNESAPPQSEEAQDDVETLRVKCTKQPFHVDVSSQKSFYDEIDIKPPIDSYDDRCSRNKKDNLQEWRVRLGDMVCIEVEQGQKAGLVTFPFAVTWSPAEIVSIYRAHSNKAECLELREKLQNGGQHLNDVDDNSFDDIMVEVRWFYRKHEIPGAGGKSSKSSQSNNSEELEELFETDQIDSCPAECLLSPIKLYEASRPEESLPSVVSGMPCIYYHCRRYWSIHRKSFIPSGLLSNRIERGRMHSKYKAALSKLASTSSNSGNKLSEGYSWKEGFQSAIQKLSLAEAAADVQVHGMELRCRERERRHIGSFLRKAIRGLEQPLSNTQDDDSVDEGPMNTKSSIFICGPPGTGKTASVRSIINELQEEQASGKLPEFNFIALNGMEMRSPFDSYVKFWEALSGTMKERLSAGAAAAKLEDFFGDGEKDNSDEDRSKKPITVLMLDEIDYLVTKKQTILYNFFDWPLRATSARLIVIGISNTINLPERLSLKLQSRLGGERCHFKSYTVDETVAILKTRLDGDASQVFDEDAIKFASRKTGNLSGDIRKAFHMCKVAAQNALDDYASGRRRIVEGSHPKVKISDVQRGSRDMYTSIIHKAISCSSSYEALVLIAIGALKKAKVGKDIVSLDVQEMLTKIESIANGSGEERYLSARLSLGDLLGILSRLGDAGILTLTTPKQSNHPWPLIQTSLEPYEINSSYRNTSHSKLAEKHLAEQRLF